MDVPILSMPRGEARRAFLDYRRAVRARHDAEDEAIMRGYRALSQGHQVLDVHDAFRTTGVDEKLRPRLAIARAGERYCWYRNHGDNGHFTTRSWRGSTTMGDFHAQRTKRHDIVLPKGVLPTCKQYIAGGSSYRLTEWRAIVPIVPAGLRPKAKLSNYHILWEAEWEQAPTDPILLRHLGGALYVVLAQWDLTPLERSVLGGRL